MKKSYVDLTTKTKKQSSVIQSIFLKSGMQRMRIIRQQYKHIPKLAEFSFFQLVGRSLRDPCKVEAFKFILTILCIHNPQIYDIYKVHTILNLYPLFFSVLPNLVSISTSLWPSVFRLDYSIFVAILGIEFGLSSCVHFETGDL